MTTPEQKSLPPVGAKIKLTRDGTRWWDVRCADERFAICTRQAAFRPKGELLYTILDIDRGVRGPCNLIGQGWDLHMSDQACAELLAALRAGVEGPKRRQREHLELGITSWVEDELEVEISHRNNVPLDLGDVLLPRAVAVMSAELDLAAALELIGRRTDIVAVQLPEPSGQWAEGPEWVQGGWTGDRSGWVTWTATGGTVMLQRVEPGELSPAQARELAAALLAAASRADAANVDDAAEGEAK